jgi:hypothetical protein
MLQELRVNLLPGRAEDNGGMDSVFPAFSGFATLTPKARGTECSEYGADTLSPISMRFHAVACGSA